MRLLNPRSDLRVVGSSPTLGDLFQSWWRFDEVEDVPASTLGISGRRNFNEALFFTSFFRLLCISVVSFSFLSLSVLKWRQAQEFRSSKKFFSSTSLLLVYLPSDPTDTSILIEHLELFLMENLWHEQSCECAFRRNLNSVKTFVDSWFCATKKKKERSIFCRRENQTF